MQYFNEIAFSQIISNSYNKNHMDAHKGSMHTWIVCTHGYYAHIYDCLRLERFLTYYQGVFFKWTCLLCPNIYDFIKDRYSYFSNNRELCPVITELTLGPCSLLISLKIWINRDAESVPWLVALDVLRPGSHSQ